MASDGNDQWRVDDGAGEWQLATFHSPVPTCPLPLARGSPGRRAAACLPRG
jgi:hypothetical protein